MIETAPHSFEVNAGQVDAAVRFLNRAHDYSLFLTASTAVFFGNQQARNSTLPNETESVRLKFVGGNPDPAVTGADLLPGVSNYLIGRDPTQWHAEIRRYGRVRYQSLYPGIDLVFYGNRRQLEFDFVVAPGADPKAIEIAFEGIQQLSIDSAQNLNLRTRSQEFRLRRPFVYQVENAVRKEISGKYENRGGNRIGFAIAAYDPKAELIIDPVLEYSTYLGGSKADQGRAIATDSFGNVYVTGYTMSVNFPVTLGSLQPSVGRKSRQAVFVTKLDPAGSLVYSTYLGGSSEEWGVGIAVDGEGSAYVTGTKSSRDFPVTLGALQTVLKGSEDIFVTKLNSAGSALIYSTYIGGACTKKYVGTDSAGGIAVDLTGNAYITGSTPCADFPTTIDALQVSYNGGGSDAVVAKLNPLGNGLLYATYLGGKNDDDGLGIALDQDRSIYITGVTDSPDFPVTAGAFQSARSGGDDAFVTKINFAGALAYSTYLGGKREKFDISGISAFDRGEAIAVDSAGHAYITGWTDAKDFPVTPGSFQSQFGGGGWDAFLTKLSGDGTSLIFSTYLGGGGGLSHDTGKAIALDTAGNVYVAGETTASDFPVTADAFQSSYSKGGDGFVAKFSPTGAVVYSSYLGGRGKDEANGVAVDGAGKAYLTGYTNSKDFPTLNALQPARSRNYDAFVVKID